MIFKESLRNQNENIVDKKASTRTLLPKTDSQGQKSFHLGHLLNPTLPSSFPSSEGEKTLSKRNSTLRTSEEDERKEDEEGIEGEEVKREALDPRKFVPVSKGRKLMYSQSSNRS